MLLSVGIRPTLVIAHFQHLVYFLNLEHLNLLVLFFGLIVY